MITKNIKRYKVIEKHLELVRSGKFEVARNLLMLLRKRTLVLGLSDSDYETEVILENAGCHASYGRNFYTVRFSL